MSQPERALPVRLNLELRRCPDSLIRGVLEEFHYLHRWPDQRSLPFGHNLLVDGNPLASDGRPFGALLWKRLQHHVQNDLFGCEGLPTTWQVLDLARVWVHPDLQQTWPGIDRKGRPAIQSHNAFSRMVSMGLKRVQRDWLDFHGVRFLDQPYHIELILSYCDRKHHQGTGYKAAGFTFHGQTADGTKDIYIRRLKRPNWQYAPPQLSLLEDAS